MKYSKSAWFVNKFDIVVAALIVPALVVGIVFTKMAKGLAMPQLEAVGSGGWIAVLVLLGINLLMGLVVVHKAWGWLWFPIAIIVRFFATLGAALCGVFILAMLAYKAQSNQKIDSAWTKDDRSSRYRDGVKDGNTAAGFGAAGGGLWGFLVSHTLSYCEVE